MRASYEIARARVYSLLALPKHVANKIDWYMETRAYGGIRRKKTETETARKIFGIPGGFKVTKRM